jgi:tetratricopeptide (TPR) repeat protein
VRFQEANQLFEAGEFEAAADRYVALVTGAPKDPNADRALNNAAVAYEKIGRFGSASKTYERIYKEYPDSEFADDALLRSGLNHVRFFEFDDAVQSYLVLANDARYKDSEHRLLALKNAADLLDNLQQYPKSSSLFVRYAAETKDPKEAVEATFRAAQVLRKTDDYRAAEAAFAGLPRQVRQQPDRERPVGRGPPAHRPDARGDGRPQAAPRRPTASASRCSPRAACRSAPTRPTTRPRPSSCSPSTRSPTCSSSSSRAPARSWSRRPRSCSTASSSPRRATTACSRTAASTGCSRRCSAAATRSRPPPSRCARPPSRASSSSSARPWFAYKDLVEQGASRFEAMAIPLYEETIKRAKEYGVANEYTRKALERMNIYKPDQYPLLHDPAVELQVEDRR